MLIGSDENHILQRPCIDVCIVEEHRNGVVNGYPISSDIDHQTVKVVGCARLVIVDREDQVLHAILIVEELQQIELCLGTAVL